jgi:SAM-dependent methyltransferase
MRISVREYESMRRAFMPARILLTAVDLGICDAIERGAATCDEITRALGADARGCRILLDALVAIGIITKSGDRYANTDLARERILSTSPGSDAAMLRHMSNLWTSWSHLTDVVRTGRHHVRPRTDETLEDFVRAMMVSGRANSVALAEKVDLLEAGRLLDLGGGPGTYAIAFCERYPQLEAVVFDLPHGIAVAKHEIAAAGLADRMSVCGGDFMADDLPTGFDAVLMSNILHARGMEQNRLIIGKARAALNPGGRIIIHDMFLDETRTQPPWSAIFAANMLVNTPTGNSYTHAETIALLTDAGFASTRVLPITGYTDAVVGSA